LEIQICEKRVKEGKDLTSAKKAEIEKTEALIKERSEHLDTKKRELDDILQESHEEEKRLMTEREKAVKKIEDKNLVETLRSSCAAACPTDWLWCGWYAGRQKGVTS
jgi:hypothetical protein